MTAAAGGDGRPTLKDRLDHLIRNVHPEGRGPYTLDEISQGIKESTGVTISVAYLSQLANGRRDNPTMAHLHGIATFFGVPVGYFFDAATSRATDEELALLRAIRDEGIRDLTLAALDLTPETRAAVGRIMSEMSTLDHRSASENRPQRSRRGRKLKDDPAGE
ncbi:helix-turn-helix domain-containing protein [Pseudonocardia sp. RS010]|uniref:helix-turn-helix domain-containing protein n=1 Tax=Pseudonocardia sp. RS010 TaxID=3385979 RepID=UPI0039A098F8